MPGHSGPSFARNSGRLRRAAVPMAVACGLLFGVFVSLANRASLPVLNLVGLVLGVGWPWAALAVVWGATTPGRWRSAARGAACLVAAVVGYYVADLAQGVYRTVDETDPGLRTYTDWPNLVADVAGWLVIALVSGPFLAQIGRGARRVDAIGLVCRVAVPAGAVAELTWRLRAEPRAGAVLTWAVVELAAVVSIVLLVVHQWRWTGQINLAPAAPGSASSSVFFVVLWCRGRAARAAVPSRSGVGTSRPV